MQDYKEFFEGKVIVVSGGAGSIGSALVKRLLEFNPKSIRVLDLDEYGLFKLKQEVNATKVVRYLLGDIRNRERVELALRGAEIVFHCAALKHIDINEYNPEEAINTNVIGTLNVLKVAIDEKSVKKVVLTGSDKAVSPSALYSTTKLLCELLFKWADNITPKSKAFCIARFCNVIESRGNVFEVWRGQAAKNKPVTLTDGKAERYFMSIDDAVELVLACAVEGKGKDIFIPTRHKLERMGDLVKDYGDYKEFGLRPGEKLVEQLFTEEERKRLVKGKDFLVIRGG